MISTPDKIVAINAAFGWTMRELEKVLTVASTTLFRWAQGEHAPVGLAADVLDALHLAAVNLPAERARALGAELRLGIGAFLYRRLVLATAG